MTYKDTNFVLRIVNNQLTFVSRFNPVYAVGHKILCSKVGAISYEQIKTATEPFVNDCQLLKNVK